jgi:hypothetical protein
MPAIVLPFNARSEDPVVHASRDPRVAQGRVVAGGQRKGE